MLKVGPLELFGGTAFIARNASLPILPPLALSESNAFVAISYLSAEHVSTLRRLIAKSAKVATLLPATNFDPPGDHPSGADFTWIDLLLNDFDDANYDVGTIAGVKSSPFQTQLEWQPRVDPKQTALVAIVEPGPWNRTTVGESGVLPLLAEYLAASRYDAIAIRAKAGDDAEFHDMAGYASELKASSGLPIFHVSRVRRDISGTPFALHVNQGT